MLGTPQRREYSIPVESRHGKTGSSAQDRSASEQKIASSDTFDSTVSSRAPETPSVRPDRQDPVLLPPSAVDAIVLQPPTRVLVGVLLLLIAVMACDGLPPSNPPLRILYLLPLALAASVFNRRQIVMTSIALAAVGEQLSLMPWQREWAHHLATYTAVFCIAGLLLRELFATRRAALRFAAELNEETSRRQTSESGMASLIESLPAAVVVLDERGIVQQANHAAESLLEVHRGRLMQRPIAPYVPNLAEIARDNSGLDEQRTAANLQARRANGEGFPVSAWLSTYPASGGKHLVAVLADATGGLRDFQESSFQTLLRSTRVLVGSVSHEIRNICAAISISQANLGRIPGIEGTDDYNALRSLVKSLVRLSAPELPGSGEPSLASVDVSALLDEFRIIMGPVLSEDSIELTIDALDEMPPAAGDHHSLLQVLLNLSRNSARALQGRKRRSVTISAGYERERIILRVSDTGPGVKNPELLFRAFQPGAEASGLGLFISRALVRSCGGELSYEPGVSGCTMAIRLKPWQAGQCAEADHSLESHV